MKKMMLKTGILVLILGFSTGAMADGLLGDASVTLTPEEISGLQEDIAEAKVAHPDHFQAVSNLVADAAVLDQRKRGRMAPFSAMFKRLGENAHMALIEVALFAGPAQGTLKDEAWFALRAGLIEAVGRSRDARLVPALSAYLSSPETEFYAIRAASEALGKIGTDGAAQVLIEAAESYPLKKGAILAGMGYCRRAVVAGYLSGKLAESPSPEMTDTLIKALKNVGNAYAWKTAPVKRYASEENPVRTTAAQALFDHYISSPDGVLRDRSLKGLVVINHRDTRAWATDGLDSKTLETRQALDRLQSRLR